MRLLVTRPEPDAGETAARLMQLGHSVIIDPLLRIAFPHPPSGRFMPAAIVLTSSNGLRAIERWPVAPSWRDTPIFAVGKETGREAAKAGFTRVTAGASDVTELAALVQAELAPSAGTILYPAARERAFDLRALLDAAGFNVVQIEAYFAVAAESFSPAAKEAIENRALDGVLFFSRRTSAIFRDLIGGAGLEPALAEVRFYAFSDGVAKPLRALSAAEIRVAETPEIAAILALLPGTS